MLFKAINSGSPYHYNFILKQGLSSSKESE